MGRKVHGLYIIAVGRGRARRFLTANFEAPDFVLLPDHDRIGLTADPTRVSGSDRTEAREAARYWAKRLGQPCSTVCIHRGW